MRQIENSGRKKRVQGESEECEKSKWESSLHQYDLLFHSGKLVFVNKNSSQVQAKHSLQAPFHLLKIGRTDADTHSFSPLHGSTEQHCVTTAWDLNPQPRQKFWHSPMAMHLDRSRNTSEEMESGRESESSGWKDGNIRKVYSQSSQFGVGLEEKLREDLELVSVQATVERKCRKKGRLRVSRTNTLMPVRFVLLCRLNYQQTGHSVTSEVSR